MQQRLSGDTAQPPRLLKRTWPFVMLTLVLSVLYFAPQLPIVRAWLLSFATSAAETAGYTVRIDAHSGNPWSGLSLEDLDVSGPGLNVSIDNLDASYYLPGLLTRKLPLSLSAQGVRGDITLSEFESSDSAGGSAIITPVLRRLSLRDVALKATDVPYTLPDITVSELEARMNGSSPISVSTLLTTPEGSMTVEGRVTLSPLEIIADVPRADVRIARQWWDGIEGGTLSGQFRYSDGSIEADAVVADGAVAFLGEEATALEGPVQLRYPLIDANLTGRTLGGSAELTGGVDIDALRWFGEATGEVALRDTALWLAEGRLPLDLSGIPITGRADAQVRASGWTSVNVSGVARGAGSLATYPLENLLVDFEYDTETATRATITGELAGGEVASQLRPTPEGFTFDLNAQNMALLESVFADVSIGLTQDGILSGPTTASLEGQLLGEPVDLRINGNLTPERWFLPITGTAFAGPFEGDVTLADGLLSAGLVGNDLDFSFIDGPISLDLAANGPPTELPLVLSSTTSEPTRLAFGPVKVGESLEGNLSAILRGSLLDEIEGNFGPLSFAGQTLLSGQTGEFSYTIAETDLSGPLEGSFSASGGSLVLQDRNLIGEADLSSSDLALPGVTFEPLKANLTYGFDESWTVALDDPQQGLSANYAGGALELSANSAPITVAGQSITLTGEATADASAVLETLTFDILGLTSVGDVALSGDANEASFELSSEPDSEGLLDALSSVKGSLRLREGTGQFTGRLGELDLFGSGDFSGAGLRADVTARSGDDSLNLAFAGLTSDRVLDLRGSLPLEPVGDLFGLELTGQVRADLAQTADGYSGSATVTTELANVPADLLLQGAGASLTLSGEARPLGIPVSLSGSVQPNVELRGSSDYGTVQLLQEGWQITGSGVTPELTRAGFTLDAQSWQLEGSLPNQAVSLTLPASASLANFSWGEGGWQLDADLKQTLTRGDTVLRLDATTMLSAEDRAGTLDGVLELVTPGSSNTLTLGGSLEDLRLSGTLPATAVSSLLDSPLDLQGSLDLNASANLLSGATYSADAVWQTSADRLVASLEGKGTELSGNAQATGLELSYRDGTLNAQAETFNPLAFIALPSVRGSVSGAFSITPGEAGNDYDGTLSLTTSEPANARVLLTGVGAGLQMSADLEQAGAALAASGELLPVLDLDVTGSLGDYAQLSGRVQGKPNKPEFSAELITQSFDIENQLSLAAQSLQVNGSFDEGLRVQVEGDALTLELDSNNLRGNLELPVQVKDDLHTLSATLGGTPGQPQVTGSLNGPLINGPITFLEDDLSSSLSVNLAPWLNDVPLSNPLATVDLNAKTDLSWQADATGSAAFRDLPLTLGASLAGQSQTFSGTGTLGVAASPVPFDVSGQGADVALDARFEQFDLGSLEPLVPLALTGEANGTLGFATGSGLSFDMSAAGNAQNRAFSLSAARSDGAPLQAQLVAQELQLELEQLQTASYGIRLSSLTEARNVDLEGVLGLSPALKLDVAGQVGERVTTLTANYAADAGLASWQLAYDDASLSGEAVRGETENEPWLIKTAATIPQESSFPATGSVSLQAQLNGGEVDLNFLEAAARVAGRNLDLALAGPAWPSPLLRGDLSVDSFDPFALNFSDAAQGYIIRAAQNGLELSADLTTAFSLTGFALTGEGLIPIGETLRLNSDLSWQKEGGFTGQADLTGELAQDAEVRLVFLGNEALELNGSVSFKEAELADLELQLGADILNNPALDGLVVVQGDLAEVVSAYSGEALGFGATLALDGRLSEPQLSGPVVLRGALAAEGDFGLVGTNGTLRLRGDGLDTLAQFNSSGWTLNTETNELALSALVPQLTAPRLSTTLEASQIFGSAPRLNAQPFKLTTANSSLQGRVRYDNGIRGRLETRADLADLKLGTALRGTLSGNLSLSPGEGAPLISGTLDALGLGLANQDATLSGNVAVNGPLTAPFISSSLNGSGSASGNLYAALDLASSTYDLSSSLAIGNVETDFAITTEGQSIKGSGRLAFGDYRLVFVESGPEQLRLEGRAKLETWFLTAHPFAGRARLTGDLSTLLDQLSGNVNLQTHWGAGEPLLSGTLNKVGFGPVDLGNLLVAPKNEGLAGGFNLSGDAVDASLNLNAQSWTVERLDLALPGGFQTNLAGEGTFSSARLSGTLTGEVAAEALALPIDLAYLDNHLELRSNGTLLGGDLAVEAVGFPEDGWRGFIRLENSSLAGFGAAIDGTLSGEFTSPQLRADYTVTQNALTAKGSFTAAPDRVSLSGEATSSLLQAPLGFAGRLWPEPELSLSQDSQTLELFLTEGRLDAAGNLDIDIGPVKAQLGEAQDAWLELFLRSRAAEGLAFKTSLANVPPQDLARSLSEGLFIEGAETTEGYILLNWQDKLRLSAQSLRWLTPAGAVSASGSLAGGDDGLTGRFSGAWQGNGSSRSPVLPWLASVSSLIFDAELSPESLTVSAQGTGTNAVLIADLKAQTALLNADWQLPDGDAKLGLSYGVETGLGGNLSFTNFPIFDNEQTGAARLDADLTVLEGVLGGNALLRIDDGDFELQGKLGLANFLPPSLAPKRDTTQALSVKFDDFDASALPWLASYIPYLDAPLDGFVSIDKAQLAGTLSSPVAIGEDIIPLTIVLGGTLGKDYDLTATGRFGRSSFELSGSPDALAGLLRFEHFPLHKGFEASAGPTDARAHLTGALRFDLPDLDYRKAYVRFATEQLRIESDGVVTEGTLSFEIEEQGLTIQEARFEGDGSWVASGEASQEQLNLRIDAQNADFSPFLGLVPQLAGLDAGAFGTLQLISSGSLINPIIRATSPGLELSLSGSAYNLEDLSLTVQNSDFVTSGRLEGVAPLTGSVRFSGGGQLVLAPERAFDLSLRYQGNPSLPVLGTLSDVTGTITARPGEPWRIESTGVLGQPFSLEGSLTPLDVRIAGNGLNLKATQFFLSSSATDTNLRFVWDRALFISGSLLTRRAQLDLDSREKRESSGEEDEERSRGGALSRVFFQDISVRAPQQITFQENFGSGELGNVDLRLGGTAATPFLNGSAEALRGTIRFAGRDFTLEKSVATFEPSQGIFPTLDIRARSSLNKQQVLSNVSDVEIIEPAGSSFELNLILAGSIEPSRSGPRPFSVDIEPTLTSNAVIQTAGASSRPLSEPELFSLLSLGRLELSQQFASQGGLATSLASGAVDTAVDLLILSELQKELGSILGLDLIEIRTSSLSSLFTGDDAGFGVSLRVGGYLSDELFASYQIGSAGLEDGIALSNEFNLRYTLDPLEFTLVGTLNFSDDGAAVPALDIGVGYALNPVIRLETGTQLSTDNLGIRFGVSFRY